MLRLFYRQITMTQTLDISEPSVFSPSLTDVWQSLTPTSCPESYNFHLHTTCSDGSLSPQALIQQAVSIGLKGLAITDHHCIEAYWQARQWLLSRTNPSTRPHLWVGLEVTAKLDDVEVHILRSGQAETSTEALGRLKDHP